MINRYIAIYSSIHVGCIRLLLLVKYILTYQNMQLLIITYHFTRR